MSIRLHIAAAFVAAQVVAAGVQSAAQAAERPPQFVAIAFDNCTELERWQEWSSFAANMNRDGDRVHFTFFVSGVNFISDAARSIYEAPHERRATSRINFGGSVEEVRTRIQHINELRARTRDRFTCGRAFRRTQLVGGRLEKGIRQLRRRFPKSDGQ